MEGSTQADSPLTVEQMLQSLKAEFALLRQQNEDQQSQLRQQNEGMRLRLKHEIRESERLLHEHIQDLQRQLKHLQRDMRVAMFLQRSHDPLQDSPNTHLTRFKDLPLEIREKIWELTVPSRLLRFIDSKQKVVSLTLSVPTVAHVYRESRHVVLRHTQAHWTWFSPYQDILLLNPENLVRGNTKFSLPINRVAEHIVIEDCSMWKTFLRARNNKAQVLRLFSLWVRALIPTSGFPYNLRTVDFAMTSVAKIDQRYPPDFVHRLFDGDYVRVVDLRDRKAVREIEQMMVDELSQHMEPYQMDCHMVLKKSLKTFSAASATLFEDVRTSLLEELAELYDKASLQGLQESRGTLSMGAEQDVESEQDTDSGQDEYDSDRYFLWNSRQGSQQDIGSEQDAISSSHPDTESEEEGMEAELDEGEWVDREVPWVKQLTELLDIRPVHVFIRDNGIPDDDFW